MIQRIQSVFLLLAAACMGGLFKLPYLSSQEAASPYFEDKQFNIQDHTFLLVLTIAAIVLSLITIFLFNNRKLQKSIALLPLMCAMASLGFVFGKMSTFKGVEHSYAAGFVLPVITGILCVLAFGFINKDDKIVKSMDRLR